MKTEELPQTKVQAISFFSDEDRTHAAFVSMRWPDGVRCAHCSSREVGPLSVSRRTNAKGKELVRRVWNCKTCKRQFTAKVGTIFEDSAMGLGTWLSAVWMLVNAKNGVSSYELARDLGITQKSAWHMAHRIREAMRQGGFEKMTGEVEADETYIGGKAKNMRPEKWEEFKQTNRAHMTAVGGLLQRTEDGKPSQVRVTVLPNTKGRVLRDNVRKNVTPGSKLFTDALRSYRGLDKHFSHEVIDHLVEWARGRVHTNGLENFWALLKRCIKGTYVCPSPFHLMRYVEEEATRFNERKETDAGRFANTIARVSGRKLTHKRLTGLDLSGPLPA